MSTRKVRSDAGKPRKPELTERERTIRFYAGLSVYARQQFKDDLLMVDAVLDAWSRRDDDQSKTAVEP
jgi:hypothetical protein